MPRKPAFRTLAVGIALLGGAALLGGCATEQSRTLEVAKVASAGMLMTGEHPDMSGKAITMAVLVETYAVFALLASILMVMAIQV